MWPYFVVKELDTETVIAPAKNVKWKKVDEDFYDERLLEITRQKTKDMVWISSHLNPLSRRQFLIKELQKYFNVDIYGKLGNLSCVV